MGASDKLNYRAIGLRIRDGRTALRLTQEQLAELADISTAFVGHLERGEKKPSAATLVALSDCLGCSLDFLLLGRENRCDQQQCGLYDAVREVLSRFGDL